MEWSLIVGPGTRLADLKAFLVPAPDERGPGERGHIVTIADLDELARHTGLEGRLLLAADELAIEDVGVVRRFLRRERGFELVLCGDDASRRAVRGLLAEPRARFIAWPPDLDDMRALSRMPRRAAQAADDADAPRARERRTEPGPEPAFAGAAPSKRGATESSDAMLEELSQIEAVLGTPLGERATRSAERPAARGASARDEMLARPMQDRIEDEIALEAAFAADAGDAPRGEPEDPTETEPALEPDFDESDFDELSARADARSTMSVHELDEPESKSADAEHEGAPQAPARYFRDQVADLADLAQRIELGVSEVREGAQEVEAAAESSATLEAPLDRLTHDVARLLQFTRTLGYLVAPPAGGTQVFDLAELLELFVNSLVARGPDAPRCLLRKNGAARVQSDRQLLSQAFDALFYVAGRAAARGEIVRVQLKEDPDDATRALVSIEFPSGPLADMEPARVIEPYALRRVLPELGPNALLAAAGIVRGQRGSLELARRGARNLEWRVRLPFAPATAAARTGGRPPRGRADDPFA